MWGGEVGGAGPAVGRGNIVVTLVDQPVFGPDDDGAERRKVRVLDAAEIDRDAEEPGRAQGHAVRGDLFEMTTKRLLEVWDGSLQVLRPAALDLTAG